MKTHCRCLSYSSCCWRVRGACGVSSSGWTKSHAWRGLGLLREYTHGEDTDLELLAALSLTILLSLSELLDWYSPSVYGRSSGGSVSEDSELIGELACRVRVWQESGENLDGSRWQPLLPSLGLLVEIGE